MDDALGKYRFVLTFPLRVIMSPVEIDRLQAIFVEFDLYNFSSLLSRAGVKVGFPGTAWQATGTIYFSEDFSNQTFIIYCVPDLFKIFEMKTSCRIICSCSTHQSLSFS